MADADERSKENPVSAVLFKRLLALHTHHDPEPMLDDAVRLLVELTGARLAIIELFGADGQPRYWRGHGKPNAELDELRGSISRGIILHAVEGRATVFTTSALADSRFADLESVKQRDIQAVLCSPIGDGLGVVYLQGRVEDGPFDAVDRERVEMAAEHIARVGERMLRRRDLLDLLQRHGWNVSNVARELGVSRRHIYNEMDELEISR